MDSPEALTAKIVAAAAAAGVRLILSKGWGGLGEGLEAGSAPEGVLLLDKPCPHDWLFSRCSAVVHHGGAGTTAAGLKAGACVFGARRRLPQRGARGRGLSRAHSVHLREAATAGYSPDHSASASHGRTGRPTCIIPVFGDQHFWGGAVRAPACLPACLLVGGGRAAHGSTRRQAVGRAGCRRASPDCCSLLVISPPPGLASPLPPAVLLRAGAPHGPGPGADPHRQPDHRAPGGGAAHDAGAGRAGGGRSSSRADQQGEAARGRWRAAVPLPPSLAQRSATPPRSARPLPQHACRRTAWRPLSPASTATCRWPS